MTAAEARQHGDATTQQRAELRALLNAKDVTTEWRQGLYRNIRVDGGLSSKRAKAAMRYLRRLHDRPAQPVYATDEQAAEMRGLVRTRVAPRAWVAPLLAKLDAGELTCTSADLAIQDLRRMPRRAFVIADAPAATVNFPDGYYALTDSEDKVRHYRIHTVGGLRQVDRITAAETTKQRRRRLRGYEAAQVIRAVAADPITAVRLYAETTKRCTACNVRINDTSNPGFPHGYGPKCWSDREAARRIADTKAELADTAQEDVDA